MENVLKTDFKSMEVNAISALFAEKDNKIQMKTTVKSPAEVIYSPPTPKWLSPERSKPAGAKALLPFPGRK